VYSISRGTKIALYFHRAHTVSFHKINEKCLPIMIISLVYNKSSKMIIG